MTVDAPAGNDGFIELEGGVQVKFGPGTYKTGDYWLIPARTATGTIEWPFTEPQPPQGIVHHYCRLGLLTFDKTQYTSIQDCRKLAPPVTELTSLFYVGGDGQVAAPGQTLPQLLQVGVANGQWPVAGATVRFAITQGSGTLQSAGTTADVVTTADGVASCAWGLGFGTQSQQVEATLLDPTKKPVHLPVRFNASFSGDAQDAGIQIERILLGDGSTLDNDANVTVDRLALAQGIQVVCSGSIALGTVSRANCFLTMEMPFPMSLADTVFWGQDLIGYQPLVVAAIPHANGSMLVWTPTPAVSAWLRDDLFRQVATLNRFPRILARLTILGNFIWQSGNPETVPGCRRLRHAEQTGRARADTSAIAQRRRPARRQTGHVVLGGAGNHYHDLAGNGCAAKAQRVGELRGDHRGHAEQGRRVEREWRGWGERRHRQNHAHRRSPGYMDLRSTGRRARRVNPFLDDGDGNSRQRGRSDPSGSSNRHGKGVQAT